MEKVLRVLMLEDAPTDAELIEHELRKAGIAFNSKRVATREAFVHALEDFCPDIILSDYKLPDFDGMAALEIVRRDYPEVPVIMVTGAFSDLDAVELLTAGAKDYILKDRLARLAPAVQRALAAEQVVRARKAAEKALQESEARYRRITEGLTDYQYTVLIENGHAVKTTQSPACVAVTGYKAAEFVANPYLWIQMVHPDDREFVTEHVRQILAGNDVPPMEHRIIRKDGETRWVSDTTILFKDASGKLLSYDGVIKDITERNQALEQNQHYLAQLQQSLEGTVRAIASIVELRDPYTAGHQTRVADLAGAIARQMGLPDDQVQAIHLASIVHDLGKIKIPAEILSKPGLLGDIEYRFIQTHPQAGYDILKDISFPWQIALMALQHHERIDGTGYPQGLKGEAFMLEARIISVADVVEAMSSHRPYRPALGTEAALEEITKYRGIYFDPQVVDACLTLFRDKGFAFKA